jgi:WD40 repeat protein
MPDSRLTAELLTGAPGSEEAAAEKKKRAVAKELLANLWEPKNEEKARANPYVGPRALGPSESIYGRDRELRNLRDLLIAERIVLLYSPWGAGKTSLIQAGLIPAMVRDDFLVLPIMRIGKNSPTSIGNRYVTSALVSLEEKLSRLGRPLIATEFAALSLSDYFEERKDLLGFDSTLLIFDQFEEILTTDPFDQEAKAEFFGQVGTVLRNTGRWALFSIREDYVAALDPYTRAVPTRLKSTFRLDLLTPDGAQAAIEQPALGRRVTFAPAATTQLVDDLRRVMVRSGQGNYEKRLGPLVEPVHLQVVCCQLWEKPRRNPSEIGLQEISAIGDVDSALGEYYAEWVGHIVRETGVKEKLLREWFDRCLISEAGIRVEVMWTPTGSEGLSDDIIRQLEAAYLIRREPRRDAVWLELSHTRLVTPIRANNARWFEQHLSLLQQQAALWYRNQAPCLEGDALIEAEKWAAKHLGDLTEIEEKFLLASREKEKVRSARRLRQWLYALCAFAAITLILAIYALYQRNEAKNQARIASARGLAVLAYRMLDERLDLANLLAYEALRRKDLPETRGTLLAATLFNPRLVSFLHGHPKPVDAVAFTEPHGELLATGDYDGNIVLWNVKTHRRQRVFPKFFKDAVRAIAFSPDGKYIAASSKDGSVVLGDVQAERPDRLPAIPGEKGDVWSIAFSRDSTLLASADNKGRITIWDVATRMLTTAPKPAGEETRSVSFSRSGALLAAGDSEGYVIVWQRQGAEWVQIDRFPATSANEAERKQRGVRITCVAFHPRDENLLASGSRDWTVNLRDVIAKRNVAQGRHWGGSVNSLAFSPDGSIIVSGAQDGLLRLWKVPQVRSLLSALSPAPFTVPPTDAPPGSSMQSFDRLSGHIGWVLAVGFSPDGHTAASGGVDREAILWDIQHASPEDSNSPGGLNASDTSSGDFVLGLSPGGKLVVTGYSDGRIVCQDRISGKESNPPAHNKPIKSIDFSRDGRFMIVSSSDDSGGIVTVSDTNSGSEVFRRPIEHKIKSAALSADGKLAAVGAYGGDILIWDLARGQQVGPPLKGLDKVGSGDVIVYAVAFSPDAHAKRVAAGGTNQFAVIWDLNGRERREQLEEHNGSIRAVEFSPNGAILATASGDNTILLSNPATGQPLGPLLIGHRGPVVALAFSPDGKMLASGSEDKGVVLWDVETKQQIGPRLMKHVDAVRALDFSSDGKKLLSVSSSKDAIVWDLDVSSLATPSRARANRNLTEHEWHAYMEGESYRKTWPDLPEEQESIASPEN